MKIVEMDFKYQDRVWWDRAYPALSISQSGRDYEETAAAFAKERNTFLPAQDQGIEGEGYIDIRIKNISVEQETDIVNRDFAVDRWMFG